jgi:hypothetical protein
MFLLIKNNLEILGNMFNILPEHRLPSVLNEMARDFFIFGKCLIPKPAASASLMGWGKNLVSSDMFS